MERYKNTRYLVTTCGKIWSESSKKFLKPMIDDNGYYYVNIYSEGTMKSVRVNRMVAICYIPNIDNKPQVNHKDTIKLHNWVNNLEWNTQSENIQHGYDNGLYKVNKQHMSDIGKLSNNYSEAGKIGGRVTGNKLSIPVIQVFSNGNTREYPSAHEASRVTGLSRSNISQCCNNKRYKTVGEYEWRFKDEEI